MGPQARPRGGMYACGVLGRRYLSVALAWSIALSGCARSTVPPSTPASPSRTVDGRAETVDPGRDEFERKTIAQRESRQLGRTWGIVSVGLGATAAALALGTSVLMLHDLAERNNDCNASKVCTTEGVSANNALSDLAPWNATGWILAAVGVGIGVGLLMANPTDKAEGVQVGVGATGSGIGLDARGSF